MRFPLYILDMANSHMGDIAIGKEIIDAVAKSGADAVKFQYRDLLILHPEIETKHHARFAETNLSDVDRYEMVRYAQDIGLTVVCTPFDEKSVDQCVRHGVDVLKIASCSADDWPLLECVVEAGLPVIASTGGLKLSEIDNLYYFLKHAGVDFALMHCVAEYPTAPDNANLGMLDKMITRYDCPVGYSGHEQERMIAPMAIAKGAKIMERHITIPAHYENAYSLSPEDARQWVDDCEAAKNACMMRETSDGEHAALRDLKRGYYEGVGYCMPCGDVSAGEHHSKLDAETKKIRDFIHEYEGMFREANIPLDGKRELSHHYGLNKFRECGAFLVTVINREYAKKLIALLPGQKHPSHLHKKKDESFQLLSGDLWLSMNGLPARRIEIGEVAHIPRGESHSFYTENGCIFEEVSTHAIVGDSYYEDPNMPDPMKRKTLLDG